MSPDWTAISAITGVVAAVVAIVALIIQARQTQMALMADFLWRLEERFKSEAFVRARRQAASILLTPDYDQSIDDSHDYNLSEILDFFEGVGLFLQKRVISADLAWNSFGSWAIPYWIAARPYVYKQRSWKPGLWNNYERLYQQLLLVEARQNRRPVTQVVPSKNDVRDFLTWEAKL